MIRTGEANPLAVFGLRRLEHCPPHFVQVRWRAVGPLKSVSDWIWENLDGRFYLDSDNAKDDENSYDFFFCAGFEIAAEATHFSLCLDQINQASLDGLRCF